LGLVDLLLLLPQQEVPALWVTQGLRHPHLLGERQAHLLLPAAAVVAVQAELPGLLLLL
jgi:hypothetical protein